jgi:lipopolysaccharide biosynthesis glycosyltransferase
MKGDLIHIGCSLNDSFLMPYGVMLVSLFETNNMNRFHIHFFSSDLSKKSIETLKDITERYHAGFSYYTLDSSLLEGLPVTNRISKDTYSWYLMAETISSDIDRLLILDGDIIVLDDIKPLWETNLNGYTIAVAEDIAGIKLKEYARLNIPEKFGYFNCGVILINLKEWIKNEFSRKVLTYAREHASNLKYLDQDAGNYVLKDRKKMVGLKWNQQVGIYFLRKNYIRSIYSEEAVNEIKKNPAIVHFNGLEKPWNYTNLHPYKKKFNSFLKISGIKKPKEKVTFRKFIKKTAYRLFGWGWWNRI